MNSRAGQQGKALTAAQKLQNYTKLNNKLKLKSGIISALSVRGTVMNSSYIQLYRCVYGNGNGREWKC